MHGQARQAAHQSRTPPFRGVPTRHRQAHIGEAPQQHLERDPGLDAGQRRTEAVVRSVPEGEVPARTVQPNLVGRAELCRIAVGGAGGDLYDIARSDPDAAEFERLGGVTEGREGEWGVVAQQLLDRGRQQIGMGPEAGAQRLVP